MRQVQFPDKGLDYDQVFSPVVWFKSVCLILAMAALEGWVLTGLDVWNAYLYGKLDEEIYMEQPEGFIVPGKENMVLCLRRALYGLKQAGLAWWQALKQSMEKLGFISLSSDAGLFLFRNKNSFVIAIIYVNDAIFCGPLPALVNHLKGRVQEDLGDLGFRRCNRIPPYAHNSVRQQDPPRSMCLPRDCAATMRNAER